MPFEGDPREGGHGLDDSLKRELMDKAREAGLLSPQVGEEWGGLGLDMGAGFLGFLSDSVGFRLDLRYVRSLTQDDIDRLRLPRRLGLAEFFIEDLSFWRTSVGLALRF